jgi:hypothetical protein
VYKTLFVIVFLLSGLYSWAQEEIPVQVQDSISQTEKMIAEALKPTKAGFYSAVFPGLGQAYNKDYWKTPIVWGAVGAGVYFYKFNHDKYQRYRTAFKLLKLGEENEYPGIDAETLQQAQEYHKKNRDLSLLVTAGLYVLQIVEASVDAHLQYHNTEAELSWNPVLIPDPIEGSSAVGLSLTYTF